MKPKIAHYRFGGVGFDRHIAMTEERQLRVNGTRFERRRQARRLVTLAPSS